MKLVQFADVNGNNVVVDGFRKHRVEAYSSFLYEKMFDYIPDQTVFIKLVTGKVDVSRFNGNERDPDRYDLYDLEVKQEFDLRESTTWEFIKNDGILNNNTKALSFAVNHDVLFAVNAVVESGTEFTADMLPACISNGLLKYTEKLLKQFGIDGIREMNIITAISEGNYDTIMLLKKYGFKFTYVSLEAALVNYRQELAKLLIEFGANVNQFTVSTAEVHGLADILPLLQEKMVFDEDMDYSDYFRETSTDRGFEILGGGPLRENQEMPCGCRLV